MSPLSTLAGAQAVAGASLVCAPERAARAVVAGGALPPSWLVRVLGARMAVQSVGLVWVIRERPTSGASAVRMASAVDAVHAASMLAAAVHWPRYRRPALVSGGAALLSFAATLRSASRPGRRGS